VNSFDWISSHVEMLFGADDVDIFAIVNNFTEERNILERENSQVLLFDIVT
jgi:hypothetical protein